MASRRRKEKRKDHLPAQAQTRVKGRLPATSRVGTSRPLREARRAHRPSHPGVGRSRVARCRRPPGRGSPKQHLVSAPRRPTGELPNPGGSRMGCHGHLSPPSGRLCTAGRTGPCRCPAKTRRGRHPSRSARTKKRLPVPRAEAQTPPD